MAKTKTAPDAVIRPKHIIMVRVNDDQKQALLDMYLYRSKVCQIEDVVGRYGWPLITELESEGLVRVEKTETGWDFYLTGAGHQFAKIFDHEKNGVPCDEPFWKYQEGEEIEVWREAKNSIASQSRCTWGQTYRLKSKRNR
jgi:hypothetical protein